MEGFIGHKPELKKVLWTNNKIEIRLTDGRIILFPTSKLPSLKKTKLKDRNKALIINRDMFTFESCPEVYHIEQILGKEKDYQYTAALQ
ncbi:MAG: hypothetical protein LBE36_01050 [Flavobacteriaceae bacterium]|jgi:hypothetical protein|nr:hypothetical protein [Flavobacteriaceae bacterium]